MSGDDHQPGERDVALTADEREDLGQRLMLTMTCNHGADYFGSGAVCETCWGNVQRIGRIVERIIAARVADAIAQARREGAAEVETRLQQAEDWFRFVGQCEAKGVCPDSGQPIKVCQRAICDCFRYPEGKAHDLSGALDRAEAAERRLAEVEAVLVLACHHCGRLPESDGDHTCPCPTPNPECFLHTTDPVAPLERIRAALRGDDQ